MNALEAWVLGYLVNAAWQVPLVLAAGWLVARLVRQAGAAMEHRVWVATLLLEAVLPGCRLRLGEVWRWMLDGGSAGGGLVRVEMSGGVAQGHGLRLSGVAMASIAVVYGCCVLYFAGRLGWGLWRTHCLRREAVAVTLPEGAWERCCQLFGVADAVVAESARVGGPVTVGMWRRALLLPVGFTGRVAAEDLEAALAHECAHMQRWDFLKNVAYGVATLPVMWHPVVWLTRLRVAESREMVCDGMAADAGGGMQIGRERYARSLLRLAALLIEGTPARTLHAIGIFDANIFERRVMNLSAKRIEIKGARRAAMAAMCVVVGTVTCASAMALRMEIPALAAQTGTPAPGPARVSGGVMAGQVLMKVNPVYPLDAKKEKIQGAVVLNAIIGKDGTVENLQVVSGPEKLRRSSLDAVRQWMYKPYLLNGEPVEVETTITVTYSFAN